MNGTKMFVGEIPQRTRIFMANCFLNVQNVHLKLWICGSRGAEGAIPPTRRCKNKS